MAVTVAPQLSYNTQVRHGDYTILSMYIQSEMEARRGQMAFTVAPQLADNSGDT